MTKKFSSFKEINEYVKSLLRKGWTYRKGGRHGKLTHPCGKIFLIVPSSPSDTRAFLNFKGDVRRMLEKIA